MKLPIYHYDRYGCFLREDRAESQMSNGGLVFQLPHNSTPIEPPFCDVGADGEREVAVYFEETETWMRLPDHRGEIWRTHRGELIEIKRPGRPLDLGFVERVKTDECT